MSRYLAVGLTMLMLFAVPVGAEPVKLQWWHAMSGQLGEALEQVVTRFNASQQVYQVVAVNKGNYVPTLNAAIAAYRAGQPPPPAAE